MVKIPQQLHQAISTFTPDQPILLATAGPDGYANVSPRGSTIIYDDETIAFWDRDRGSQAGYMKDGTPITLYFRRTELRDLLPPAGSARFFGKAKIYRDGPIREKVWEAIAQPEKDRDPERKGFAVLVHIERAENLTGVPLALD